MATWKPIEGYSGYLISSDGHVYSEKTKRELKQYTNRSGHYFFTPCINGVKSNLYIDRVVAQTFLDNPDNLPWVGHKDGNLQNNNVDNLYWTSIDAACNNPSRKQKLIKNNARSIMIEQYTVEGDFVRDYPSISQAEKLNKYPSGSLYNALKTTGYSHGYRWVKVDKPTE